ncbi:hypothetical protein AB3S75_040264 [Citrus x aurantiifolia]
MLVIWLELQCSWKMVGCCWVSVRVLMGIWLLEYCCWKRIVLLLEVLLLEYFHSSLEVLLGNLAWCLEFELFFLEFNWNLTIVLNFGMVLFILGCFIMYWWG